MADYCNITTDFQRAYSNIEHFQHLDIIESWAKTSGQTNVYEKHGTGYNEMVFEDGTQLTIKTSVADVDSNASSFYYDGNVDKLYIHTSGSDAPSGYTIEYGEDWDAFKTVCRDDAQEMLDSLLNNKFETPLAMRSRDTHNTASNYNKWIVMAAAKLACYLIISRDDPASEIAEALYKAVDNPNPDDGEMKGIVQRLYDGDIVLEDQVSVRESGGWNVYPDSSNTVTVRPVFSGEYTGTTEMLWRIQIDTAGALGTATYKVSYDGGSNWDLTLEKTKDDTKNQIRFYIASGVWVRWPAATYVKDEFWDLELFPITDEVSSAKVGFIPVKR